MYPAKRLERRRGLTLVEMLIAMTTGGLVLSIVASLSLRQQRLFSEIGERNALRAQLRDGGAVLAIDVRSASPLLNDLREARDTSLELRATIGSGIVCDTSRGVVVVAPAAHGVATLAAFQTSAAAGDTLWILSASAPDSWTPHGVVAASTASGARCAPGGPVLPDSATQLSRVVLTLADSSLATAIGMPARITRPVRYSGYRASDGAWYLGEKDWNGALARFNTIQPVAGAFLSAGAGGITFGYADSAGNVLPSPVADRSRIVLVRLELRGVARGHRDSVLVSVALRNRH